MTELVRLEIRDEIAALTFNRPETHNAFNLDMVQELSDALVRCALDTAVTGVVMSGKGKSFCSGGDLSWVRSYGENTAAAFHELAARYHLAVLEIRRMPKPVVAAINGIAAGGGFSLALACDFRVMEESAVLRQAYTTNGLSIDGGGTFMLPRLVGLARAMEIAAFDEPIYAEKALDWGLVMEVVPDGESVDRAKAILGGLKTRALSSFAASKKLFTDAFNTSFEAQLENERDMLSWCGNHPNGREGIAAFLEKRKAKFNRL
jgi:2-(1,2-epoxy-1,2-dihydrophenyl)acetyl-CoA isomerase